jgi:hypothetical protein
MLRAQERCPACRLRTADAKKSLEVNSFTVSFVVHYGSKVHYDGVKNEEAVIQIWAMGWGPLRRALQKSAEEGTGGQTLPWLLCLRDRVARRLRPFRWRVTQTFTPAHSTISWSRRRP